MTNFQFNKDVYAGVAAKFEALLAGSPSERAVQSFLKLYPYIVRNALNTHAWNLVRLSPEFSLGGKHIADFLILSQDSGGWHAILIELESPTERPFTKNRTPAKTLNKGLAQLDEWKIWIDKNDGPFREALSSLLGTKSKSSDARDQRGHIVRDPRTVIHKEYVVAVGRRAFFDDSDSQERRAKYYERGLQICSYDRLLDMAKRLDPLVNA